MQVTAIQRTVPATQRSTLRVLVCALRAVAPDLAGVEADSLTRLLKDVQLAASQVTRPSRCSVMLNDVDSTEHCSVLTYSYSIRARPFLLLCHQVHCPVLHCLRCRLPISTAFS